MAIHLTLAVTFFNFVGTSAARVVLTLYALELGAPASAVGVLGGLLFLFPLLAGFSIDNLGHAPACLVIASQSVVAIVLLLVWGKLFPRGNPQATLDAGASHALADREVWRMLVVSGLVQLGTDLSGGVLDHRGHHGLGRVAVPAAGRRDERVTRKK